MTIATLGFRFELTRSTLYVRLPFIGAAFIGAGLTTFNSWTRERQAEGC